MPQGKGTYGKQVGRPPKKDKYEYGGKVDPFSTKNPEGVPAKQAAEMMEKQNMANKGIPTTNAMERSQTSPDAEKYKDGGKVKSKKVDITDVVKEASKTKHLFTPSDEDSAGIIDHGWPYGKTPKKWGDVPKSLQRASEAQKRKSKSVKKIAEKALKGKKK